MQQPINKYIRQLLDLPTKELEKLETLIKGELYERDNLPKKI